MKRKYPTLDLLKIMQEWNADLWQAMISKCIETNDLEKVKKTLYGIQAGMDLLAKNSMNTQKIMMIFATMTRSLELAAKKIIRKKYPSPLDAGFSSSKIDVKKQMQIEHNHKRSRDLEFKKFLKEARF